MSVLASLKPEALWKHFAAFCEIPHGSKNEAAILDYLMEQGKRLGCEIRRDSTGNLCLHAPASPGFESAPTVILQGHVDMVCEKRAGLSHDFLVDPIRPRIEGEWVYATETTLGADNGIGVAAALAVLEDPTLVHGPLELLFTVDEETGLTGALGLDPTLITGRLLLNTDSEEDGVLYVGCAGGQHLESRLPVQWTDPKPQSVGAKLSISGLMGGHSGGDIHKNHGNAIKLLVRALAHLMDSSRASNEFSLGPISAGTAHNAIPRDGEILLAVQPERLAWLGEQCVALTALFRSEFPNEAALQLSVSECAPPARVLEPGSAHRLVSMLLGFHNGVFAMSRVLPGLVETSNSLALIQSHDTEISVLNSTRSSQPEALKALLAQNEAVARLAGATSTRSAGYPGWQPNMDSPLLKLVTSRFESTFGKPAAVTAIHAGLECGLIGERFDGMDMISFGPEIQNPHSPQERAWIPSVERFWRLLSDVLQAIAKGELQAYHPGR